jgi:hypothetical protein
MQYYIFAVASTLLCYGFSWLSHGAYYYNFNRAGNITIAIAVILGVVCLGFFLFGSLEAASAFAEAAKHMKQ